MNKNFISMCQEAKEIQDQWTPKIRDLFLDTFEGYNIVTDVHFGLLELVDNGVDIKEHRFWLPRQEDLQEILLNHYQFETPGEYDTKDIMDDFYAWYSSELYHKRASKNLNELWISFIMNICFNKKWNGETWVKL